MTSGQRIDTERQRQAREYARIRRRLSLSSTTIFWLCGALFVSLQGDIWWRDQVQGAATSFPLLNWQPLPNWYPLQILVYFLLAMIIIQIITLPLSYYLGFILPHRYQLSVMSRGAWIADYLKGHGLGLAFQIIMISLIYALLAFQPQSWWLWVAIFVLLYSVVIANLAPVLLFPLFYKFTPMPDGDLKDRLLKLAAKASTRVRGVYTMELSRKTTAANAALMGLGNTRRIVVGDTLLDRYTPDEIEAVLAHELGHHVHNDLWKFIVSGSILTLAGLFLGNLALHLVVDSWHHYYALSDPATLPLLALLSGLYGLITTPLNNLISRRAEYQADEYALQSTGKIAAFKSMMARLADQNLAEVEPSPLIEMLFHSHPSPARRLKHADDFAARQGS